jgi:hypothetical protein
MKIAIDKDTLNFLLGNIWHVADKKSTMRILSCVLLRASKKDGTLMLATTNIRKGGGDRALQGRQDQAQLREVQRPHPHPSRG